MKEFQRVLRKYRGGMTQADLAKLSGVSAPAISKLENGMPPTCIRVVTKILMALKVSREDFVDAMRCIGYDVNYFPLPTYRGTEETGMRTIEEWAGTYHDINTTEGREVG